MAVNYYDRHADALSERYLALPADDVHASWAGAVLASRPPGVACDVGAGSGRDANWLARQGWEVIAVEPSRGMRERAEPRSHSGVSWLDDRLPGLRRLRSLGHRFDLILVSAVWMHLRPEARERAFRTLGNMLRPGGALVITLRHGEDAEENRVRGFYPVTSGPLEKLAHANGLDLARRLVTADAHRADICWETLVFARPA